MAKKGKRFEGDIDDDDYGGTTEDESDNETRGMSWLIVRRIRK